MKLFLMPFMRARSNLRNPSERAGSGVLTPALLTAVRRQFRLDWGGVHGAPHWARVRLNGLAIAARSGARVDVIELFAFLHDSCRHNEYGDRRHGSRAVDFARTLRGDLFQIDNVGFDLLAEACRTHSDGATAGELTVRACWDADRLDLWRVGITPDPRRLATAEAREEAVFAHAQRRAWAWRQRYRR